MQVILLATGETDKLRPLTEAIPSPMLPVANRPVMTYIVEVLARQGIREVVTSLYYLPGSIEAYFGTGRRWGIEMVYVLQREAWGTAGALKWAESHLPETFLVLPADVLVDVDIAAVVAAHHAAGCLATALLTPAGIETGVYVFAARVLDFIPARTTFDIQQDLIPALAAAGEGVHTYVMSGFFNPLATFADYQAVQRHYLNSAWQNGRHHPNETPLLSFPSLDGRQIAQGIWMGRNNLIHPTARLAPPVAIGDNSRIGRDVELGPYAVVGTNVIIDDEATVSQSTVLDYTYVGQLVNVEQRIVAKKMMIDPATSQNTEVADDFLLGEAHPAVVGSGLRRMLELVVASSLLFLLLPLVVLIALVVLATTGRVFCPAPRLTGRERARPVVLTHFCTRRADGTYTPAGPWLERLAWDRLPELWNVVQGKLALVGVKPLQPDEAAQATAEWQRTRYAYPAGFTGLWFVQTEPDCSLDEVLVADAYYAAIRTWREDVRLLWRTPAGWWRRVRGQATRSATG